MLRQLPTTLTIYFPCLLVSSNISCSCRRGAHATTNSLRLLPSPNVDNQSKFTPPTTINSMPFQECGIFAHPISPHTHLPTKDPMKYALRFSNVQNVLGVGFCFKSKPKNESLEDSKQKFKESKLKVLIRCALPRFANLNPGGSTLATKPSSPFDPDGPAAPSDPFEQNQGEGLAHPRENRKRFVVGEYIAATSSSTPPLCILVSPAHVWTLGSQHTWQLTLAVSYFLPCSAAHMRKFCSLPNHHSLITTHSDD